MTITTEDRPGVVTPAPGRSLGLDTPSTDVMYF